MIIRFKKPNIVLALMVFFSMTPFVLPFPGLGTDLQPYALLLSLLVLFCYHGSIGEALGKNVSITLLVIPAILALLFVVGSFFSFAAFRGAYNHLSIFFVLLAWYILLERFGFPERQIKIVIWIWCLVATVQFFLDREFLSQIISGDRENTADRGVAGFCSEASFFGISCFYFLHLANRFDKRRVPYLLLITAMAVIYAQSMQGLLFVAVFYIGLLVESVNSKKGLLVVLGILVGGAAGYLVMKRIAPDSRLITLLDSFLRSGIADTVEGDVSATVRMNSILDALAEAFGSYLIPQGFARRIGSGFGGLLVELGIFGLLETLVIAYSFCLHFKKLYSRVVYFLLVYFVMFSNTQMGNPQMLLVLAANLYFKNQERKNEKAVTTAQ